MFTFFMLMLLKNMETGFTILIFSRKLLNVQIINFSVHGMKKNVGVFIIQEEHPTLHSICTGFDYCHSSASFAYSWMHYAFIAYAIEANKYQDVDVGLTADEAKKTIGFKPIQVFMDIYSSSLLTRGFLRAISRYVTATITPNSKVKFKWKYYNECYSITPLEAN